MKYDFLVYLCTVKITQCGQSLATYIHRRLVPNTSENYRKRFCIGSNRVGGGNKPGVQH